MASLAGPGDRVAILGENVVEYVDAYYGVPQARMALVLVNDRLDPHELAWILDDAEAKVLLVHADCLERMLDVRDEWALPVSEIMAACCERLAGFTTPKDVRFVDELPKNGSGKILKRELRDQFGGG